MKITAIKQQLKQRDRYSFYIDDTYAFSLSESALLQSGLSSGTELSASELERYKKLSTDDKLYNRVLRYVAMRPRSVWEVQFYMQRKEADSEAIQPIIDKLHTIGLLNDIAFAQTFVRDRRQIRHMSNRKLQAELARKRIAQKIVDEVLTDTTDDESIALKEMIQNKRRQTKYQDDEKLMQYLARQGFRYGDIKQALSEAN